MKKNNDFFLQLILDINNVKFNKKTFKGSSVKEVDQFLDNLINNLRKDVDFAYRLKELEYLIKGKQFSYSLSGYNPQEVDMFLNDILKRIMN